MTPEEARQDLIKRLQHEKVKLQKEIRKLHHDDEHEHARLKGKLEGVELALGHIRQQEELLA